MTLRCRQGAKRTNMAGILVLNGPNLNLLGKREPHIYGPVSLKQIEQRMHDMAQSAGVSCRCIQSNAEHVLLDAIHKAVEQDIGFIIINAGAYTHTSIAIRDALTSVAIPFVEVHLSNVYQRESFRHHSYLSAIAKGVICGFGELSYELAMQVALISVKE